MSKEEKHSVISGLIIIALVLVIISSAFIITDQKRSLNKAEAKLLEVPTPYSVHVKNDHDVYFTNSTDTIMIQFENASIVAEESIVFIKRK